MLKTDIRDEYDSSCYTRELTIGKIIDKIDKKYLVNPLKEDVKRILSSVYGRRKDGQPKMHPNQKDHKVMSEMLFERLSKI